MITLGELLKLLNKYGVEIKIAKGTPWEYEVVMKEIIEDYTKWPVKTLEVHRDGLVIRIGELEK